MSIMWDCNSLGYIVEVSQYMMMMMMRMIYSYLHAIAADKLHHWTLKDIERQQGHTAGGHVNIQITDHSFSILLPMHDATGTHLSSQARSLTPETTRGQLHTRWTISTRSGLTRGWDIGNTGVRSRGGAVPTPAPGSWSAPTPTPTPGPMQNIK